MVKNIFLKIFVVSLVLISCEKKKDKEENSDPSKNSLQNTQSLKIAISPKLTPPVESNSPEGFQAAFQLHRLTDPDKKLELMTTMLLDSATENCNSTYDSTTQETQWRGCRAAASVKEEFYSGVGPTDIATLTKNIDSRIGDIFRNSDWSYMPCFDRDNTAGGTYNAWNNTTNATEVKTYKAFSEYTVSPSFTFEDNKTFDTGLTGYLSCYSSVSHPTPTTKAWVSFGRKDGNYYISEGQSTGLGSLAKISTNGDVELLFALGTKPTAYPSAWEDEIVVHNSSTGLIHLKSFGETGLMEVTTAGMGPGHCGSHFLSNGKLMYIEQNDNEFGACSANDNGIGKSSKRNDNGVRAYDSAFDNLKFCLDVSSSTAITAYSTLDKCTDVGLSATNFKLGTLNRGTFRAINGMYMYSTDLVDSVAQTEYVSVSEESLTGSDTMVVALAKVTETENSISTNCADNATSKSVALSYKFDVGAELTKMAAEAQSSSSKPEDYDETAFKEHQLGQFKGATGDNLATIKFTVGGSAGGTKWADFDLAASLKIDGSEVGTASYTETTDHAVGAQAGTISADFANLTATSVITLDATGNLKLGCTSSSSRVDGTATLRLSFPRAEFTVKSE